MSKRKKIAIKGHTTRGKEVIQILEMLGGYNKHNMEGNQEFGFSYVINNNDDNSIECRCVLSDDFKIFTVEEFFKKFPYQKRQQVIVSDGKEVGEIFKMRWTGKTIIYTIEIDNDYYEYTANELNHWNKNDEKQVSQCDNCSFFGSWKCIDYGDKCNNGKIIEKSEMNMNDNNVDLTLKISTCYVLPDGFHFADENGNVIDSTKILLVKNSPSYPKTYEECCDVIGISRHEVEIDIPHPYQQNMFNLFKLLICRDAYWKIAGDEMGLGKPWEFRTIDKGYFTYSSRLLVFPTVEMRDAFYKNFKELIEQCNKLLLL